MATILEQTIPVYQFPEMHRGAIDASPEQVWHALRNLRHDQLRVTRPLAMLRGLGKKPTGTLFADGPIRTFVVDAPNCFVGGSISRPWRRRPEHRDVASLKEFASFDVPGWTKFLTDFRIESCNRGVLLTTETRGYSTDDHARRRFAPYWAFIRPWSGLIRRDIWPPSTGLRPLADLSFRFRLAPPHR